MTVERIYRGLLRALPRAFRREAEAELVATFRDGYARARARGRLATLRFWTRTAADLMVTTAAERKGAGWSAVGGDLRVGVRTLARTPGFTAAAILTFGLGIGVNIAVLSVVDRMMFRPLPYRDVDRLVHLHNVTDRVRSSPESYLTRGVAGLLRRRSQTLADVATARVGGDPVGFEKRGVSLSLETVSHNLLQVLGVRPIVGRDFTAADLDSRDGYILLSEEAWIRHFGRSMDVLFTPEKRDGWRQTLHVIGILPRGFLVPTSSFAERADGVILSTSNTLEEPGAIGQGPAAIARLRPGVDVAQARAEIAVLMADMARDEDKGRLAVADAVQKNPIVVQPLRSGLFFLYRPYVWLIVTGVSAVFLVACVNLATLFLARGRAREQDAAIRSALGASRLRIVRAALAETMVLCLASAALAMGVCYASFNTITAFVPLGWRSLAVSPLDLRLVAIAVALAIGAAVLVGVAPALRAARADVVRGLRRETRSTTGRLRGGAAMLAVETALGIALVAGAATTVRSLFGILYTSPGYESTDLRDAVVPHGRARSTTEAMPLPERVRTVLEIVRAMPGVAGAAVTNILPVGRVTSTRDPFWQARGLAGSRYGVGGGFFNVLGTPLLAGREFNDQDLDPAIAGVILNRVGAAALWSAAQPVDVIGRTIETDQGQRTVIGVAADLRPLPGQLPVPTVFVPITGYAATAARPPIFVTVIIRPRPGGEITTAALSARLDERMGRDTTAVVSRVADDLPQYLQRPKFQAMLFGSVAAIGLLLASIGLYAVAAFDVARRRFEIGVRLSLGATAADIRRLVIRGALRPVIAGAVAGLLVTWWAAKFLQAFVFEVDARDPWTFALVALVLMATAIAAAWLPARRAARTDPTTVLRAV